LKSNVGAVAFSCVAVPLALVVVIVASGPVGLLFPNALYGHCHTGVFVASVINLGVPR
jgi:hypothetical protein